MEEIVKTTRYWLFKKSNDAGEYYYVRVKTDGIKTISWSLGYKNHLGLASLIGGTLSESISNSLENEFQEEVNRERKEMLNYKVKI